MINTNNTLTLTILANITANYGEGIGNISQIQKVYKNGLPYAKRSKESLKRELMEQSGLYASVKVQKDGKVAQKVADKETTLENCPALEAGYMNTTNGVKRESSFYFSDAISVVPYTSDFEFHNNLGLVSYNTNAKDVADAGLMPFSYEYSKDWKIYSFTVFLDKIGIDKNFDINISNEEKATRVIAMLDTLLHLGLVVKGSLDNASPLAVFGGFTKYRTHELENLVQIKDGKLLVSDSLKNSMAENSFIVGITDGIFENESEIKEKLNTSTVSDCFAQIKNQVRSYYGV